MIPRVISDCDSDTLCVIRYERPLTRQKREERKRKIRERSPTKTQNNTPTPPTRRPSGRTASISNSKQPTNKSASISADIIEIPLPISSPPKYLVVLLPLTTRDASLRTTSRVSCCPPTIIDRRSSIVPAGQAIITSVAHRPHDSKYDDKR